MITRVTMTIGTSQSDDRELNTIVYSLAFQWRLRYITDQCSNPQWLAQCENLVRGKLSNFQIRSLYVRSAESDSRRLELITERENGKAPYRRNCSAI